MSGVVLLARMTEDQQAMLSVGSFVNLMPLLKIKVLKWVSIKPRCCYSVEQLVGQGRSRDGPWPLGL